MVWDIMWMGFNLTWNDIRKKTYVKKIGKKIGKEKGYEWCHETWNISHDVTWCDNLEFFGKFITIAYDVCLASLLHH